jgi:Fe2+ or Zn2+ uptake regulation protein
MSEPSAGKGTESGRPDLDEAAARMRSEGHRMGQARRQVLDVLAAHEGALSADDVATALPGVHVSSVYRTLNLLEEIGLVTHVHLAHGPARYELSETAQGTRHLVCEVCGRDVVVPSSLFDEVRRRVEHDYRFVMDADHFAILGRCTACTERRRAASQASE